MVDKSLIENASREQLLITLNDVLAIVEKHDEVEWEVSAPSHVNDNDSDDGWYKGQSNGESYMANHIEGIIRASLKNG